MSDDVVVDETSVKTFIFYLIIQQIEKKTHEKINMRTSGINQINLLLIVNRSLWLRPMFNLCVVTSVYDYFPPSKAV